MLTEGDVFTHDPGKVRGNQRRLQNCPKSSCAVMATAARLASGVASLDLDCDEYPPASAEEGGRFSWASGTLCVPSYQNNQHGQCISESTFAMRMEMRHRAKLFELWQKC